MVLTEYLVGVMVSRVMEWLHRVYDDCGAVLPKPYKKYWKRFTFDFLSANDNNHAWGSAARAGSGKTMWMTAFILTLCEIAVEGGELCQTVMGGMVFVVQKIETINEMVDVIERYFPGRHDLIGAIQSFSPSGKKRGLCMNPEAAAYDDCVPIECSYAESCPIVHSTAKGHTTLITGITQARFLRYRRSEDSMHRMMYRTFRGVEIPRRFLFFDEKFEMAEILNLSKEGLNIFSNSFEQFSSTQNMPDNKIAAFIL